MILPPGAGATPGCERSMSTFPFVQVQGALALPHIRPLARLPVSFGREWALTPPHSSLRAELRALYAAILRTVCLSAEAFRAAARWDTCHIPAPRSHRPVAAPIGSQTDCGPTAARAAYAASSPATSLGHKPPIEQHRLAGGAVAIGGAALLAWIVASHAPHEAATETGSANARPVPVTHQDASHHLAEARAQHEPLVTGPVRQAALPPSLPATSLPRAADSTSVEAAAAPMADKPAPVVAAPAPAQVHRAEAATGRRPAQANLPARTKPDFSLRAHSKTVAPARLVQREPRGAERIATQTAAQRLAQRKVTAHHDVHEFDPHRETRPVTTHRARGAYSEASSYSPRQTGANQADEFASILAYAKTYAPAQASSRPAVTADSTDWVNHVSQRRITDVPDRFAK